MHTTSRLLPTAASYRVAEGLGLATATPEALLDSGYPQELLGAPGECGDDSSDKVPLGDGTHGIFEAYLSSIQPRGTGNKADSLGISTQLLRAVVRTDCVGETAGALSLGALSDFADSRAANVSANLLDYLFFTSKALNAWPRNDPSHATGGTLLWGTNLPAPHAVTVYADVSPATVCPQSPAVV